MARPRSRASRAMIGPWTGGRLDVAQVGNLVFGGSFGSVNHKFSFASEGNLVDFLKGRIGTTARKMALAAAHRWIDGQPYPLVVEGAALQDNRGRSSSTTQGDRVFWKGHEAAHFGIGTVTSGGEALSIQAARGYLHLKADVAPGGGPLPESVEARGDLVRFALVYDGQTYWAPTFVNRTEGGLERILQPQMSVLIPSHIPPSVDLLEGQLQSIYSDTVEFLLRGYAESPWESRYFQDPKEVAERDIIFQGDPGAFKDAVKAAVTDPGSTLHSELRKDSNVARTFIEEVVADAEAAKT